MNREKNALIGTTEKKIASKEGGTEIYKDRERGSERQTDRQTETVTERERQCETEISNQ